MSTDQFYSFISALAVIYVMLRAYEIYLMVSYSEGTCEK